MLSARFELAIFRVSGERINQLSHESKPLEWPTYQNENCVELIPYLQTKASIPGCPSAVIVWVGQVCTAARLWLDLEAQAASPGRVWHWLPVGLRASDWQWGALAQGPTCHAWALGQLTQRVAPSQSDLEQAAGIQAFTGTGRLGRSRVQQQVMYDYIIYFTIICNYLWLFVFQLLDNHL